MWNTSKLKEKQSGYAITSTNVCFDMKRFLCLSDICVFPSNDSYQTSKYSVAIRHTQAITHICNRKDVMRKQYHIP